LVFSSPEKYALLGIPYKENERKLIRRNGSTSVFLYKCNLLPLINQSLGLPDGLLPSPSPSGTGNDLGGDI
jgi:hypothetical protein